MRIVVINNGTAHLNELLTLLNGHAVRVINRADFTPRQVKAGELVVLSGAAKGSPSVVWDDFVYEQQLRLIKDHKGPIIGICLGIELIAYSYGAQLYRRERRIRRLVMVKRTASPYGYFLPKRFVAFVAHRYAIRSLDGHELISLAHSSGGVEVLRHKTKPVFGVQFHPEVRIGRNGGKRVFEGILKEIQAS